jgi:hypothetical protein
VKRVYPVVRWGNPDGRCGPLTEEGIEMEPGTFRITAPAELVSWIELVEMEDDD